jgi:hypothetical protein
MARQAGLEPAACGLEVRCSILLSYWRPERGENGVYGLTRQFARKISKHAALPLFYCNRLGKPGIRTRFWLLWIAMSNRTLCIIKVASALLLVLALACCYGDKPGPTSIKPAKPGRPPRISKGFWENNPLSRDEQFAQYVVNICDRDRDLRNGVLIGYMEDQQEPTFDLSVDLKDLLADILAPIDDCTDPVTLIYQVDVSDWPTDRDMFCFTFVAFDDADHQSNALTHRCVQFHNNE